MLVRGVDFHGFELKKQEGFGNTTRKLGPPYSQMRVIICCGQLVLPKSTSCSIPPKEFQFLCSVALFLCDSLCIPTPNPLTLYNSETLSSTY